MQKNLIGNDYGMFVLGRKILLQDSQAALNFYFKTSSPDNIEILTTPDQNQVQNMLAKKTRLGRIGILLDRNNATAKNYWSEILDLTDYTKKDRRALNQTQITVFETQVLRHMAEEGLADSVEFRRLARKFIRPTKHAQCDTLYFPELIFGEDKTKKILQHLAGPQTKVFTPNDFIKFENQNDENNPSSIKVFFQDEDPIFLKHRAEQILQRKIKATDLIQTK